MSVILSLLCSSTSHPLTYSFKLERLPLAQEPVDSNIPSTPGAGKALQPGVVTLSNCYPTPMANLFKTCLLSVWHVRSEKNSEIFLQILFFVLVGIKGHLENGELLKNVALRLHLLDRLVLYSVQLGNASLPNLTCCGNYLTRRVVICQICPGSDDRMTYPRG